LLTNIDFNTSIGARLAMWEISLFQLAPVGGFSGIGKMSDIAATVTQLQLDPIKYKEAIFNLSYAGPHSDFLDNLLRMGYIGAAAYTITIAAPWLIFWQNRLNKDLDKRAAAHTGLYFLTGIFFCGLANGMITHKYSCSFYGLILACLLADVLRPSKSTHSQ
jgi:O-antigen ligase